MTRSIASDPDYKETNPLLVSYEKSVVCNPSNTASVVLSLLHELDHFTFQQSGTKLLHAPMLRKFKSTNHADFVWFNSGKEAFEVISPLCTAVMPIFAAETRVLKVQSPIYVLGDLHGNFHDLMAYERLIWPQAPFLTKASYLFLGNYVDYGPFGIEVACYLFAMKIQNPDRVFLLRGNHEVRSTQLKATFKTECTKKYGEEHGNKIFELINNVFDCLPVAAVIDEGVFCVHGGIPKATIDLQTIVNSVPMPLDDPQRVPVVHEMLCNEPATPEVEAELRNEHKDAKNENGYIANYNSETGERR